MTHPDVDVTAEVPESAIEQYQANGWAVVNASEAQSTVDEE